MKLLRAELKGKYKGLENQTFNFSDSSGKIVALIGLNGCGKSQFLEVICEYFAWLERLQRPDFKASEGLTYRLDLAYEITTVLEFTDTKKTASFEHQTGLNEWFREEQTFVVEKILYAEAKDKALELFPDAIEHRIFRSAKEDSSRVDFVISSKNTGTKLITSNKDIKLPLPSYVIGYSSGQNENLQRSFLKNAFQYYEVMRIRGNYSSKISESKSQVEVYRTTEWYSSRHPGIETVSAEHIIPTGELPTKEWSNLIKLTPEEHKFLDSAGQHSLRESKLFNISDRDTPISSMVYLDYDTTSLLMASLLVLGQEEVKSLLPSLRCSIPNKLEIAYDLRGYSIEDDIVNDIKQLHRAVDGFPNAIKDTVEASASEVERFGIDFICARLELDLTCDQLYENFKEAFFCDPLTLFKKLYRIQLLGIKHWSQELKSSVSQDSFIGNVKKPLKGNLPIKISKIVMTDDQEQPINFDDFSDGEHQLIQVIAASRIFRHEEVLFVLDEPETHLNPSWRTYFHEIMSKALSINEKQIISPHVLLSTHSPFLVSSLSKDNVFVFDKDDEDRIEMSAAEFETFGTAFEVLIKQYFKLDTSISQTAVNEVKERLKNTSDAEALSWIENNLGDSMDKAYLLRKLQS